MSNKKPYRGSLEKKAKDTIYNLEESQHRYLSRYNAILLEMYRLIKSNECDTQDNNIIWSLFERYVAIMLTMKKNSNFYCNQDIHPDFKEHYLNIPKNDCGIDLCDLKDTIVQCKLRKGYICWRYFNIY